MTHEELEKRILQLEPQAVCSIQNNYLTAVIPPSSFYAVAKQLREAHDTNFDYLFSLTGIDKQPELGVVYHLESTKLQHIVVLQTYTSDRDNPTLDTVSDIWKTAKIQEREVFDFFGIHFTNHPDMRRIFMEDDWVGYPLRKDYVDTINIIDLIK